MAPNILIYVLLASTVSKFVSSAPRGIIAQAEMAPKETSCSPCPPGYGVERHCSHYEDTFCRPCETGYHSTKDSTDETCQPCSLCGDGLFELHPCTSTVDVFCARCRESDGAINEDYINKCITYKHQTHRKSTKKYEKPHKVDASYMLGDDPMAVLEGDSQNDMDDSMPLDETDPSEFKITVVNETENGSSEENEYGSKERKSDPLPEEVHGKEAANVAESGAHIVNNSLNHNQNNQDFTSEEEEEIQELNLAPLRRANLTNVPKQNISNIPMENITDLGLEDVKTLSGSEMSEKDIAVKHLINKDTVTQTEMFTEYPLKMDEGSGEEYEIYATKKDTDQFHLVPEGTTNKIHLLKNGPTKSLATPDVAVIAVDRNVPILMNKDDTRDGNKEATPDLLDSDEDIGIEAATKSEPIGAAPIIIVVFTCAIIFFLLGFYFNRYNGSKRQMFTPSKHKNSYQLAPITPTDDDEGDYVAKKPTPKIIYTFDDVPEKESDRSQLLTEKPNEKPKPPLAGNSGKFQSPIDICPDDAVFDDTLARAPLVMNYVPENTKSLINTGTTVKITVDCRGSDLHGGPLQDTRFCLDHFHFHWGTEDHKGSEHTINGSGYAAELHLVHWNKDLFKNFNEAAKYENGLCVIGVFLESSNEKHQGIQGLLDVFASIRYKGASCEVPHHFFDPGSILPARSMEYWTYPGSLTVAPYNESVQWIVMRNPIKVSHKQMEVFRDLRKYSKEGGSASPTEDEERYIRDNYRCTMNLGDRVLKASFR